ncbi:unnamed protein product, partial [marine sediment metagenome]
HRSQSGELAHELYKALMQDKEESKLKTETKSRQLPDNITFIGFTATPKQTTLEN